MCGGHHSIFIKLKKEDEQLTNPCVSYEEKIPTLITVWTSLKEAIVNFTAHTRVVDKILEWVQRHTLNLVLHGDWAKQSQTLKNSLHCVVRDFDEILSQHGNISSSRCKGLIKVIKDPWGDSILNKILNGAGCTKDEELSLFSSENGYIVGMRLKKLCDSHCEDLALRFANACLRCLRLPESRDFHVITTEDQKRYILDIYIALLHKYQRTQEILNELKNLTLEEGLQLVYRFNRKRVELARIWKHCSRIAELAVNYFLTAAMTQPVDDCAVILSDLFRAWIVLNDKLGAEGALPSTIRRIIQASDSSAHIYICIEILNKHYGESIKPFIIELYIRALTTDINELEKYRNTSNFAKVTETSKRLAEGFLSLADVWKDNLRVSRECVLTSFSLDPTESCMAIIEQCAESSGKIRTVDGSDSARNDFGEVTESETVSLDTGQKRISKFTNTELNKVLVPQALGLSEQLCDDLVVVLSGPRYMYLSWVLEWNELKTACKAYLEDARNSRNVVKELKYLHIDYSQFKDWPEDDKTQYGGIEKGYEQFSEEEDETESSDYYSKSSDQVVVKRRRRRTRRYNSDSDYEIKRKAESSISDDDSTSADTDSWDSDEKVQVITKKRNLKSSEKISRFSDIINSRNDEDMRNLNRVKEKMCPLDHREKPSQNKPCKNDVFMESLLTDRRSDPTILKRLRMFRNSKKRDREESSEQLTKNVKKEGRTEPCLKMSDGKLIQFPLIASLNPRVLLDRQDCNNFENRMLQKKNNSKPDGCGTENKEQKHKSLLPDVNMNPFVMLNRCDDLYGAYKKSKHMINKKHIFFSKPEKKCRKLDVLADVPGLNSLEMIRPSVMNPTVQVVQLTSNMTNAQIRPVKPPTNTSSENVQPTTSSIATSIPVTAHIQRVGQPLSQEKSSQVDREGESPNALGQSTRPAVEVSQSESSVPSIADEPTSQVINKVSSNQSTPTLVNILSHQIIRPAHTTTVSNRNPTLINILSQQIIRPPIAQLPQKIFSVTPSSADSSIVTVSDICVTVAEPASSTTVTTTTATTSNVTQLKSGIKLVTSTNSQPVALQQIFNVQGKSNTQVMKNVNLVTNSVNPVDATRLVQFLYKTGGKVVQLTPYSTNANIKLQALDASKLIKTTTANSSVGKQSPAQGTSAARSSTSAGYEEIFAKFTQTTGRPPPAKNNHNEFSGDTEEAVNSLPKFQQAFGKAGYQQTSNNSLESAIVSVEQICTTPSTVINTSGQNVVTEVGVISKASPVNTQASFMTKCNTTSVTTKAAINNKSAVTALGVQGSIIYSRQEPVSLTISTGSEQINIIPSTTVAQTLTRNQLFKITSGTGEPVTTSKDNTVIRNKMSALLATALQSNVPNKASAVVSTITSTATSTTAGANVSTVVASSIYNQNANRKVSSESEVCDGDSSSNDSTLTSTATSAITNTTSTLVTPMRITLPMMQRTPGPNGLQTARIMRPILQIPQSMIRGSAAIRQQVLLAAATPVAMTGVVTCSPQAQSATVDGNLMAHNSIEPSVSSTTLEQLREFDLVLEQVKERSTVQPSAIQNKVQVVKSPVVTNADLQEVISNVNVSYINPDQNSQQKLTSCTSVVVVTSYCNVQPAASPALSVTSQSSSSPCVTPAPSSSGSSGKTIPKSSAKSPKSKTVKTSPHATKTSPIPKPQQKPQEDEQTTQRIYDILAEYAEQLRNSPDLNNKPAPRRRSNPPTNPNQNSKRKKCSTAKKSISIGQSNSIASELSPGTEDPRTVGSEDSCGIVQLSVQDSPQETSVNDDHQSPQCSSDFSSLHTQQTETSDSVSQLDNPLTQTGRQFIFSESNTNQSRNVIIADSAVSEALVGKLSNTAAVIVPANYIVPMVKGDSRIQPIAVVSGNSKILGTVPARSGSNMLLFQSFQTRKLVGMQQGIKSIKYSTVQPLQGISSQIISGVNPQTPLVLSPSRETVTLTHPLSFKKITEKTAVISTDKSGEVSTVSGNTTLPIATSTSQKCNVIFAAGNVSDISNIAVSEEDSAQADDSVGDSDQKPKSPAKVAPEQCIKIMPICGESSTVDNDDIRMMHSAQANSLLENTAFSINFSSKESTTVPAFSQIVSKSPDNEKDKARFLPKVINTSIMSENKTREFSSTDKGLTTSNPVGKFSSIDCTADDDRYTKIYIEDKKKSNTNGPMLAQSDSDVSTNIIIRRESDKVRHKQNLTRAMSEGTSYTYQKQKRSHSLTRSEKEIQSRKQEALERELCLQKSLSEECEDLGVDEPSTSDLFPEADLLFDSNNSPSFDQLTQDIDKKYVSQSYQIEMSSSNEDYNKTSSEMKKNRVERRCETVFMRHPTSGEPCAEQQVREVPKHSKEMEHSRNEEKGEEEKETTVTLFSDDDNSDSVLRTNLLFDSLDYPSGDGHTDYNPREKSETLANGSKDTDTVDKSSGCYSGSFEESSMLMTCASSSDDQNKIEYGANCTPRHKYKYKYCNRKRQLSVQSEHVAEKASKSWEGNQATNAVEVIKMLSSEDEDTSESLATVETAKSSASHSSSPVLNERKRSASPNWEENNESSNHSYRNVYSSNKLLKLSANSMSESCPSQDFNDVSHRKSSEPCTFECLDSSTPSPMSLDDGELGSYGVGRGARRSSKRIKKKCHCCASPEKPKKLLNIKKNPKGPPHKKR